MNGAQEREDIYMRSIAIRMLFVIAAFFGAAAAFPHQAGAEEAYLIESFEDLEILSRIVSEGEGDYTGCVRLLCDIEAERPLTPIGDEGHMFSGSFDGGGYAVSGLHIDGGDFAGLFGCVGVGGRVENLVLVNPLVSGGRYTGAVAGYSAGSIERCAVLSGRIIGRSMNEFSIATGGVVGLSSGRIKECVNSGGSVYGRRYVGGVVGSQCASSVERCIGAGSVYSIDTGDALAGGVAGSMQTGAKAKELIFAGRVLADRASRAGGVAGGVFSGTLSGCVSAGVVSGREAGGIAGFVARRAQIMHCRWMNLTLPAVGEGRQDGTLTLPPPLPWGIRLRFLLPMIGEWEAFFLI